MSENNKHLPKILVPHWFSCLWVCLFFFCSLTVYGQKSKAQLEREKKQNLKKIAEANRILKETTSEKRASLGQLTALTEQISSRAERIAVITREIRTLEGEATELSQIATSMEQDIANLQREYASMVYATSKANNGYARLAYLFSADTFNKLVMRFKYLQQYTEARKTQVKQIQTIRDVLQKQRTKLGQKKQEKDLLLQAQVHENTTLLALKTKQNEVIARLSAREKELEEELAESNKAVARVDKLVADLVEEERRARLAENNSANNAGSVAMSSSFAGNKSRLIWPVETGFISSKFGEQPHPVLKGIKVNNHGVGIQTSKGQEVRAVYDGEIMTVATIPGLNKLVAVQHGDYTTVYAKLGKVVVKTGQKIKAKQILGEVYTDKEGTTELQFQIWRNQEKLDPQVWLADK
jgi:septal ring factor EnvC (AmiA/AmiB activator)